MGSRTGRVLAHGGRIASRPANRWRSACLQDRKMTPAGFWTEHGQVGSWKGPPQCAREAFGRLALRRLDSRANSEFPPCACHRSASERGERPASRAGGPSLITPRGWRAVRHLVTLGPASSGGLGHARRVRSFCGFLFSRLLLPSFRAPSVGAVRARASLRVRTVQRWAS